MQVFVGLGNSYALWRAKRRAEIQVLFMTLVTGNTREDMLVLLNRGAAEAREVAAKFDVGGNDWEPFWQGGSPFPVPVLAAGESLAVPVSLRSSERGTAQATITWHDRRFRKSTKRTTVSLWGFPIGGGVTAGSIARDMGQAFRV